MVEKTIAIRIDEELHRRIKIRLAENGMTLKDYIIALILNDLDSDNGITKSANADKPLIERFLDYDLKQLFDMWKNEGADEKK